MTPTASAVSCDADAGHNCRRARAACGSRCEQRRLFASTTASRHRCTTDTSRHDSPRCAHAFGWHSIPELRPYGRRTRTPCCGTAWKPPRADGCSRHHDRAAAADQPLHRRLPAASSVRPSAVQSHAATVLEYTATRSESGGRSTARWRVRAAGAAWACLVSFACVWSAVAAATSRPEVAALQRLFNSTGGPSWTAMAVPWSGSDAAADPCTPTAWTGVACGCSGSCVVYVLLVPRPPSLSFWRITRLYTRAGVLVWIWL